MVEGKRVWWVSPGGGRGPRPGCWSPGFPGWVDPLGRRDEGEKPSSLRALFLQCAVPKSLVESTLERVLRLLLDSEINSATMARVIHRRVSRGILPRVASGESAPWSELPSFHQAAPGPVANQERRAVPWRLGLPDEPGLALRRAQESDREHSKSRGRERATLPGLRSSKEMGISCVKT